MAAAHTRTHKIVFPWFTHALHHIHTCIVSNPKSLCVYLRKSSGHFGMLFRASLLSASLSGRRTCPIQLGAGWKGSSVLHGKVINDDQICCRPIWRKQAWLKMRDTYTHTHTSQALPHCQTALPSACSFAVCKPMGSGITQHFASSWILGYI